MLSVNSDKTAERQLQKMMTVEPRLFSRLADRHLRAGESKKAAKVLVKGLQQFPDSVSGWLVKGKLHLHLKQPKLARAAFEKAISIDPEIPIAHRHSAELAQEEGDIDGYLNHLRALGALEPLDDNIQTMLQTAILRQTAVAKGVFNQHQVERMMPGSLRQALLRANALPPEIARRTERFAFPQGAEAAQEPASSPSTPQLESQPVWRDPKVKQQIAKMEEEDRDRLVRVSWAEAVNNPSETPLVEIDADGLDNDTYADDNDENMRNADFQTPEPPAPPRAIAMPSSSLPSGMQKAMIKPYIPQPKPIVPSPPVLPDRETAGQSKVLKGGGDWVGSTPSSIVPALPEAVIPKTPKAVSFESDWEGATPTPPAASISSNDMPGMRGGISDAPLRRPRLTADIKLPPMRSIDAADIADQPPIQPPSPPPTPQFDPGGSVKPAASKPVEQPEPKRLDIAGMLNKPVEPELPKTPVIDEMTPPIREAMPDPDIDEMTPPIREALPSPVIDEVTPPIREALPSPVIDEMAPPIREAMPAPVIDEVTPPIREALPAPVIELPKREETPPPPPIVQEKETKPSLIEQFGQSGETHPEPARIARDDSSIQRLMQAKRETPPPRQTAPVEPTVAPPPPRRSVPALTRFEMPDDDAPPPPVFRTPIELDEEDVPLPPMVAPVQSPSQPLKPVLSPLKPRVVQPAQRTAPLPPPPKVNERLEIVDEVTEPSRIPLPVNMPPPPPPPDLAAREEIVRQKLAAIVEEVTGKTPELEASKPASPVEEKQSDYHLKGKIATKTLAELYASQGDWARSAEVYEALLDKFPTNEAYRKRLEALKAKINEV